MSKGEPAKRDLGAQGMNIAVCATRWNAHIVEKLLAGAQAALKKAGAEVAVYRCSGAFELAPLCARVARKGGIDGIVAIGCLIRGGTDHYRVLSDDVARGLGLIALQGATHSKPLAVTFGVLTCETEAQAEERANKGTEFAATCIEQIQVLRGVDPAGSAARAGFTAGAP